VDYSRGKRGRDGERERGRDAGTEGKGKREGISGNQ